MSPPLPNTQLRQAPRSVPKTVGSPGRVSLTAASRYSAARVQVSLGGATPAAWSSDVLE
jgi:hypothetical protein